MSKEMSKDEKRACQVVMDAVGFYVDNLNDDDDFTVDVTFDEEDNVDSIIVEEYGGTGYYNDGGRHVLEVIRRYQVEIVVTEID